MAMRRFRHAGSAICALLIMCVWTQLARSDAGEHGNVTPVAMRLAGEPAAPLLTVEEPDLVKLALGERMYTDPRLSGDGAMTCSYCHDLSKGGSDGMRLSKIIGGGTRSRNTPTIFNVAMLSSFNWDGAVLSLRDEVQAVMESKKALGVDWNKVVPLLQNDRFYSDGFRVAYGGEISRETIVDAMVTYVASLVTPDSAFDRYLKGDSNALTMEQKQGYRLFKNYGCSSCHQGTLLGGNLYAPFGVFGNYVKDRGNETEADWGRFNVTKQETDKYVFRVPSLRNVALTSPYFHDGSVADLDKAVSVMAKYQLGREISHDDIEKIVKFLHALTGRLGGLPL